MTWSRRALDLAMKMKLGTPVCATAALFVLRFCTQTALVDVPEGEVTAASVLLATKAQEGFKMSIRELIDGLSRETGVAGDRIVAVEELLLQTLDFDLQVFLIDDSLNFFMEEFLRVAGIPDAVKKSLYGAVVVATKQAFVSNTALLFAPSQLAIAVLAASVAKVSKTAGNVIVERFDSWLNSQLEGKPDSEAVKGAILGAKSMLEMDLRSAKAREALAESARIKCEQFVQQQEKDLSVSVKTEPMM